MERVKRNRVLILATIFCLFGMTTLGFSFFEDLNLFDSLWMTFTSILTIGYGDFIPQTQGGRTFALIMVPLCIIAFTYLAGNVLSTVIESNLTILSRSKRMMKKIKRYNRHILICGADGMSNHIVEELRDKGKSFVLIDRHENRLAPYIDSCTVVVGDPSEEEILIKAGIQKAEALIAVKNDADNLLICLTARELKPDLNIICSAEKRESEKKLKRAGADFVINPERIGGNRMILSALKPAAVDYIDKIFRDSDDEFHVEKFLLTDKSTLVGKNLKQARLRELYHVSVMGIHRDGQILTSNLAELPLQTHDALILFGKEENLEEMEEEIQADSLQ